MTLSIAAMLLIDALVEGIVAEALLDRAERDPVVSHCGIRSNVYLNAAGLGLLRVHHLTEVLPVRHESHAQVLDLGQEAHAAFDS